MKYELSHSDCLLAGDIHLEVAQFLHCLMMSYHDDLSDVDIIILGDIGLGFKYFSQSKNDYVSNEDNFYLESMNEFGKSKNITFWIFRGNHDDPKVFTRNNFSNLSNVKILEDGDTIIDKHNRKYLIVGGGVSIDRFNRREGISYWSDEIINLELFKSLPEDEYDGVLAHTGPVPPKCNKNTDFLDRIIKYKDNNLKDDLENELKSVDYIIEKFNPKVWYNGHYHMPETFNYKNVKIVALDIFETYHLK